MKEFVEKLIGRLEEEKNNAEERRHKYLDDGNLPCVYDISDVLWSKSETLKEIIKIVNQLAEEYNNGWIHCSERLPNKEEYLKDDGRFIVTDGNRRYMTHFDIYETQKFGVPQLNGFCEDKCVIAWQSLPAPFKKGE